MPSPRIPRARLVLALALAALLAPAAAQAADFKPQLVRVSTPTPASKDALQTLGLDLGEGGTRTSVDAFLWHAADAAKLRQAGFGYRVRIADLAARSHRNQQRDRAFAAATAVSELPSGSTEYRTLDQVNAELDKLAKDNPGLVREFTLPEKSLQGREIKGIEIAQDVGASDGRPVFLQLGAHHAREWPSVEHVLEWGYEMVNGTKSGDPRATRLTKDIRTIVIPVVNPDGFNISRTFGDVDNPDGGVAEVYAFKRKNCNVPAGPEACEAQPTLGTDPNRNYGGLWGGPGASTDPTAADYRGPGPFSEPETRNIKSLISGRQVTTMITNHTYAALVLRPPGVAAQGPPIDEPVYKELGDAMAARNGYISQPSYDLYDTTGTTEDWSYYSTGGLGFTIEIGTSAFHPSYQEVIDEWFGTGPAGKKAPVGGGDREAYYVAAENTATRARHSVIDGKAPADTVLRLHKEFMTKTSPVVDSNGDEGPVQEFKDTLDTTMTVPAAGSFEWDINPSTRPAVAPKLGRDATGPPSDAIDLEEQPVTPAAPVEIPFTYTKKPGRDDETMTVEVTNPLPVEDYDLVVYRKVGSDRVKVGSASGSFDEREAATIKQPAEGDYILELTNFAASGVDYDARVTFQGPRPAVAGTTEAWTLTCETPDGKVLGSEPLVIARGERKTVSPCPKAAAPDAPQTPAPGGGSGGGGGGGGTNAPACTATADGLSKVRAAASGRGLRLAFTRRRAKKVDVDVFQVSAGRRVIGERLVARFRGKKSAFNWNGKVRGGKPAPSGTYFVRYRGAFGRGADRRVDTRRVTLRRSGGRFRVRPSFYRRDTCSTLRSYKLERAVFGGTTDRSLGIAFRLAARGKAGVTVLRGSKVVKRFATKTRGTSTTRLRLSAKGLARGDYRFRLKVKRGGRTTRATLTSERL